MYNETKAGCFLSVFAVALLAEGVDRNPQDDVSPFHDGRSLSSRRAWIEIVFGLQPPQPHPGVALLAEGVDRNGAAGLAIQKAFEVALLAEGVDRNNTFADALNDLIMSLSSRRAWIEMKVEKN